MDTSNPMNPLDSNLSNERFDAKALCTKMNATPPQHMKARAKIYQALFGKVSRAYIEPNFFCDYGSRTFLGDYFYANHNCVFIDGGGIHIGDRVLLGPNVQLISVNHPLDPALRATGVEYSSPVTIGDDCWIGAGAIIMPGVTLGKGCVIGAGAIVTKDVPDYCVAVGNPARVIKRVDPADASSTDEKA